MAVRQGARTPAVDLRGAELTSQAPRPRGESGRQSASMPAGDGISVVARLGPFQPTELGSLMQALLESRQGKSWGEIHRGLVSTQASSRVHIVLRYLLPAILLGGLESFLRSADQVLDVQFEATEVAAIRRLVRQLEALRTPFTITVSFSDRRSGTLRASWDLGLDQASIAIVGELPGDAAGRRRLLSQMEELLAR
jgi:hypothetical protein